MAKLIVKIMQMLNQIPYVLNFLMNLEIKIVAIIKVILITTADIGLAVIKKILIVSHASKQHMFLLFGLIIMQNIFLLKK